MQVISKPMSLFIYRVANIRSLLPFPPSLPPSLPQDYASPRTTPS